MRREKLMIDLHTHSAFSDGSLSPEELVAEAKFAKLAGIALTDHDSVDGVRRFLAACRKGGIRGVPGVEISLDGNGDAMHMLGYFIDHNDASLKKHLEGIKLNREYRNRKILENLTAMGLAISMNEVSRYAGSDNVGRLHFAQALVERGYVKSRQEAFDRFLAKGKPAYVNRKRLLPADGIAMIRNAGGLAVLAHPFTLGKGKEALIELVAGLVEAGLAGIEVYYPQHTAKHVKCYLAIASKFRLAVTGGTDFHGAPMPDIHLGTGFGSLNVPDSVLEALDERRNQ